MTPPELFDVATTVLTHLKANFSTVPIHYPGQKFDPEQDGKDGFIRPTFLPTENSREAIVGTPGSSGGILVEGLLSIQVFEPTKTGFGPAYKNADELVALFSELELTLTGSGARLCFGVPTVFNAPSTESWFQVNLTVEYHHHTSI